MHEGKSIMGISLYSDERDHAIHMLDDKYREELMIALRANYRAQGLPEDIIHKKLHGLFSEIHSVSDIEKLLPVTYIERTRDFSDLFPIETTSSGYTREALSPLLDALAKGDFELAKRLCPKEKQLMGYRIITEPTEMERYGADARDYWIVEIPPGVYPIFANEYNRHEGKDLFTNEIKDFGGVSIWLEGIMINAYEWHKDSIGKPSVEFITPYAHAIAKNALNIDETSIHFISPFKPVKKQFISSVFDNKPIDTYSILNTSLPKYLHKNPLSFHPANNLDSIIKNHNRHTETTNRKVSQNAFEEQVL